VLSSFALSLPPKKVWLRLGAKARKRAKSYMGRVLHNVGVGEEAELHHSSRLPTNAEATTRAGCDSVKHRRMQGRRGGGAVVADGGRGGARSCG